RNTGVGSACRVAARRPPLQLIHRALYTAPYPFHLFCVLIFLPRPEKPSQSILFPPRDDVHVQVWNALADTVVHRHEGALCAHRFLDGGTERGGMAEQRTCIAGRKIRERGVVWARD